MQPNPVWMEEGMAGGQCRGTEPNFRGKTFQTQNHALESREQQGTVGGTKSEPSQSWLFYTEGHPVPKFLQERIQET